MRKTLKISLESYELNMIKDFKEELKRGQVISVGDLATIGDIILANYEAD